MTGLPPAGDEQVVGQQRDGADGDAQDLVGERQAVRAEDAARDRERDEGDGGERALDIVQPGALLAVLGQACEHTNNNTNSLSSCSVPQAAL